MEINAKLVKELRDKTGAGMMDCKKALAETAGDMEKAAEWLRVKGISKAGAKSGRIAAEGLIGSYIHSGRIGVLVEINCESDFVARGDAFQEFVREVSMHIAAARPKYVRREDVPQGEVDHERDLAVQQIKEQGKPEAMHSKIAEGMVNKWLSEICLLDQPWVRKPELTIEQLRADLVQKTGENVQIRRFERFELGEGIEKKKENFAEEILKMQEAARANQS